MFAMFPKTNSYMLVKCDNFDHLKTRREPFAEDILEIEEELPEI